MDSPVRSENFRLVLSRPHPDMTGPWNATLLHQIAAARGGLSAHERLTLATMVLDAGARLDLRDTVLPSTPLGWACRWAGSNWSGSSWIAALIPSSPAPSRGRDREHGPRQ